jgi:rubrerythrin
MTHLELRRLFERALGASLLSPLLLGGCGPDLTGYEPLACDEGRLSLRGMQLAQPVDGVQLRSFSCFAPEQPRRDQVLSTLGTPCSGAADAAACQRELEALAPMSAFRMTGTDMCHEEYLASTRGDVVEAHTRPFTVLALLGAVDTPQEAGLMARFADYRLACGSVEHGGVKALPGGGWSVIGTRGFACGAGTALTRHFLHVSAGGEVTEERSEVLQRGSPGCVVGRRPVGLLGARGARCLDALGEHFAQSARLEAASVTAFLRLRAELALHGAPRHLQRWATRSAREEVEHTRVTRRLARRFGARPEAPEVEPLPLRPLAEVALENAVEGCVRETYGALVGHHQARHAEDAEVREAFGRIAEDETRHAALSWQVHAWAQGRLSRRERAILRDAQRQAVDALRREVAEPVDAALVREAGVPDPAQAAALLGTLEGSLWA